MCQTRMGRLLYQCFAHYTRSLTIFVPICRTLLFTLIVEFDKHLICTSCRRASEQVLIARGALRVIWGEVLTWFVLYFGLSILYRHGLDQEQRIDFLGQLSPADTAREYSNVNLLLLWNTSHLQY